MEPSWMALFRRVIGAEGPGRHFRQPCGVLIVFGVIFIHGNLWHETTGQLSEEYTSSCIVFNTSQERPELADRNRQIQYLSTKPADA
jgi:hypothetical protein